MTPTEVDELNRIIGQYQWAIGGMATAIVALAGYIAYLHKHYGDKISLSEAKHSEEMRELAVEQIKSSTQLATALENNNKLWERFLNMDRKK
jgi:hypothetical protein